MINTGEILRMFVECDRDCQAAPGIISEAATTGPSCCETAARAGDNYCRRCGVRVAGISVEMVTRAQRFSVL